MSDLHLKNPENPSGPAVIRNLSVSIDRDICIGAATCVAIAPQTFTLDSEAKAVILSTADVEPNDQTIDAARGCPVAAVLIQDTNGEKIFPK